MSRAETTDDATFFGTDFLWLLNHSPAPIASPLQPSPPLAPPDDIGLVTRVMQAYRLAQSEYGGSSSFWDLSMRQLKGEIEEKLLNGTPDAVAAMLRDPAATTLFWGFDAIAKAPAGQIEPHEYIIRQMDGAAHWTALYAAWVMDGLRSLADAVGATRVVNPEAGGKLVQTPDWVGSADALLDAIEGRLGCNLDFPNPFPGELGVPSSRGVISFRAVQAVYQAWRIAGLAKGNPSFRVLEIGAGLGRTAYYAARMGIADYTIIDIPLTEAAQAYFLGRTLGADRVSLHGETHGTPQVRIVPAHALSTLKGEFDLILNVDSITEMSAETASGYYAFSKDRTGMLLSVNHELNNLTMQSLYLADADATVHRHPYWMRRGYVEELVTWPDMRRQADTGARIRASGLFDSAWYSAIHPEVAARGDDPLGHYLTLGASAGYDPNPLFSTGWYLRANPDVAASGENPLAHYVTSGARAHCNPNPLFDTACYLANNPGLESSGRNPLAHYLTQGAAEGQSPHPLFDADWYLSHNLDVLETGMNPLAHYLTYGGSEGRSPHPAFDGRWYLTKYPDVAALGINPLVHYVEYGAAEGRHPHPDFAAQARLDGAWKALKLPDLFFAHDSKVIDKWEHYLSIYDVELASVRHQGTPVRLLEIGVQNGGSVELWAKYLPPGSSILGVDIDDRVADLRFESDQITVAVADATDAAAVAGLLGSAMFDIIIDDGSHVSDDIRESFLILFKHLAPGGRYILEDLHACYWGSHGGGYRTSGSAIEWLKQFVDAVNADHIQQALPQADRALFAELTPWLGRISFYDSFAVVEKLAVKKARPYRQVVSGQEAHVITQAYFLSQVPFRALSPMLFGPLRARRLNEALIENLEQTQRRLAGAEAALIQVTAELETIRAQAPAQDAL